MRAKRSGRYMSSTVAAGCTKLPGVTARWLLDHAHELGLRPDERLPTPADLHDADAIWLTSSLRGLAEIRTLDRTPRPHSPLTTPLLTLLGFEAR